ncbi:hypothetical protein IAR50_007509 [Cryptococcus sp. DSM 104548]
MQPNGHPVYHHYPHSSISTSSLPPQSPYSPYPPQSPYSAGELGQIPYGGAAYGSVPSSTSSRSSYGAPPPIPSHSYPTPANGYPANGYPNPHPNSYSNRIPTVESVPSPVPKVAYEAPVFQTFQERKRAKDAALRAKASQGDLRAGRGAMPPPPVPQTLPPAPQVPPVAYSIPPSAMRGPSPGPEAMAMMAKPGGMGPPPVPPTRSRSPATSPSGSVPPSPVSSQGGRPLPPPRGRTPMSVNTGPASGEPPLQPAPHSTPSHTSFHPYAPTQSSSASSTQSQQPDLDRSDTLSSVKSLDRASFSSSSPSSASRRPLPKPPGGVVTSKSLDRGTPSMGDIGEAHRRGRRQPSTVNEESEPEEELANGMRAMGLQARGQGSRSPSPQAPAIVVPTISAPSQPSDPHAPAKFTPLPSFSFSDSDAASAASEDESYQVTPKAKRTSKKEEQDSSISFAGAPMITVSSSDTADEPMGEISFAVPSISVGGPPAISIPIPSISTPQSHSYQHPNDTRTRVQSSSAILCTGCGQPIIGRIVNAMNQRWHPQCFTCAECGELLEHVSSYEFEGKAYCHLDYHDKFAHRCHHCKTPIVEPRFITLNDDVLGQRYYHELHFFCSECGDPFLDPSKSSAPGTEKARANGTDDGGDDGETSDFVIHKGHPYCENCHVRLHKPKCKGCRKPIRDMAVGALGGKWHKECFVCTNCKEEFANGLFFPREGGAFCTTCYETTVVGA